MKNGWDKNAEYVIGIDSGGTNYRVQADSLDGEILGSYVGTAASHYFLTSQEVKCRISHHINKCLSAFGGKPENCRYLVCGTTGLDSDEDGIFLNQIYQELEGFNCPTVIKNDVEIAHRTVIGGTGILVISGTGSIAFGINRRGESKRIGGWEFSIMGEEGSGTWVDRKALRHLADCYDNVAEESLLTDLIKEKLAISTINDLTEYSAYLMKHKTGRAGLGETVNYAAEQGDKNALYILTQAAGETAKLTDNLIRVLGMEHDPEIPIGVWGSNILKSRIHLAEFQRLITSRYPQSVIRRPTQEAVSGAAQMARELFRKNSF